MEHNASWLRESGVHVTCTVKGVTACVHEAAEEVAILAIGEGESLDAVLCGFHWHILLCSKAPTEPHHHLIHCKIAAWLIAALEVGDQWLQDILDVVDALPGSVGSSQLIWSIQKNCSKWLACEHSAKEGDFAYPLGQQV